MMTSKKYYYISLIISMLLNLPLVGLILSHSSSGERAHDGAGPSLVAIIFVSLAPFAFLAFLNSLVANISYRIAVKKQKRRDSSDSSTSKGLIGLIFHAVTAVVFIAPRLPEIGDAMKNYFHEHSAGERYKTEMLQLIDDGSIAEFRAKFDPAKLDKQGKDFIVDEAISQRRLDLLTIMKEKDIDMAGGSEQVWGGRIVNAVNTLKYEGVVLNDSSVMPMVQFLLDAGAPYHYTLQAQSSSFFESGSWFFSGGKDGVQENGDDQININSPKNASIYDLLAKHGVDPAECSVDTGYRDSCGLAYAVEDQLVQHVKFLIKRGVRLNVMKSADVDIFRKAISHHQDEIVNILIQADPKLISSIDASTIIDVCREKDWPGKTQGNMFALIKDTHIKLASDYLTSTASSEPDLADCIALFNKPTSPVN